MKNVDPVDEIFDVLPSRRENCYAHLFDDLPRLSWERLDDHL